VVIGEAAALPAERSRSHFQRGIAAGGAALAYWVVPILLLVLWQIGASIGLIDPTVFPGPLALLREAWDDIVSGKLATDSVASIGRVAGGLGLGVVLGAGLGLSMALWRPVEWAFSVPVQILRAIPPITWIGFSILWFGLGTKPAIFLITLGVVFPMLLNTYSGVRQVDSIYIRAARNVGATGWMLFKDVILAAAMPSVLTGLRVSVGLAWILVVVGELVAVPSGLGATLMRAQDYDQTDRMLTYMLVIGLYGYVSDLMVVRLSRHLLRWQRSMGQ
jgi:NitT/TauT family transport system permease protein